MATGCSKSKWGMEERSFHDGMALSLVDFVLKLLDVGNDTEYCTSTSDMRSCTASILTTRTVAVCTEREM